MDENNIASRKPLRHALEEEGFKFSDSCQAGAAYIMQDGAFLNLSDNTERLGRRSPLHPALDIFLASRGITEDRTNRALCLTDGAIRMNDGTVFRREAPYFVLPYGGVTNAQLASLAKWLDSLCARGITTVECHVMRQYSCLAEYAATFDLFMSDSSFPTDVILKAIHYEDGIANVGIVR